MMKYYHKEKDEVLKAVGSGENGLSSSKADELLRLNGKNELIKEKGDTLFIRFLKQMKDPMVIILITAAVISGIIATYANEGFADTIIIMLVVVLNAVLGVYQENKAEKAIESLQEMSASTTKVIRDGEITTIKSSELVVGDVILLEAGDVVPSDGRIIENASIRIEESALTGESVAVDKTSDALEDKGKGVPLGDRINMIFSGSIVVYGRGKAVITSTGMDTEMGKIADAISKTKQGLTPLQMKLSHLSKILSYIVIGVSAFIFIFGLIRSGDFGSESILNTFMVAVSLAVAAIPEGLAMVVTVVLSIGVTNMSKKNAIVRRLTAVETLGSTQIICSDKTGTLTQNKMTVVDSYSDDKDLLAKVLALSSDAHLTENEGHIEAEGEPTESALVNFSYSLGINKSDLDTESPRVAEIPFNSDRKRMSTIHKTNDNFTQYTKGGIDEILAVSTSYLENGEIKPLTDDARDEIIEMNHSMARKALRVLAAAMTTYITMPDNLEESVVESNLTFVGFVGIIDPIRPEVKDSIAKCKDAGIATVMITGDHKDTAIAIANDLAIIDNESQAISGVDLDHMDDDELGEKVVNYRVYARVNPEHKVRIVNAWQKNGYITAMTGDGVNDAPCIKNADIGIAMGITGTDVTKDVADMVLVDDNFSTIVGAVEEGRKIYDNILKSVQFLLASNMSEVLSIFIATLLGFTILHPVHLLWINLITDTFPALALGLEEGDDDIMKRKPRSPKDSIFSHGLGFDVIYQGAITTVLTLASYFVGHYLETGTWEIANSTHGITMAFMTLSFTEIFHSFNMRSQRNSIFKLKKKNMFLIYATIASLISTTAIIYIPFLAKAFKFETISVMEYCIALLIAFSIIPIVEVVKWIQRKNNR